MFEADDNFDRSETLAISELFLIGKLAVFYRE